MIIVALKTTQSNAALVNLALGKPASQQSNFRFDNNNEWTADKGNDGNADTDMFNNHCFHTDDNTSPWWEVDLQDVYYISQVNITNRQDAGTERAESVEISVARQNPGNWQMVAYNEGQIGSFISLTFAPVKARYVRVTLRNKQTYLHLCEVEVFGENVPADDCAVNLCFNGGVCTNGTTILSLGKPASQSSKFKFDNNNEWTADKGNDGNADSDLFNNHCFHTDDNTSPWWEVDLQDIYDITQVNITNRQDAGTERAQNIEISIAKENPGNWSMVAYKEGEMGPFMSLKFDPVQARYVRVTLRNKQTQFHLCEVEVYGYK
ncbi:uncharacterized protein LOC132726895 [Ruditapes philippinarum]|uniref:uncharacterized protein LOC132726895 n=1 Tax=Ruditapes philippinarum TaxID=129788 RepID=UPI00295B8B99|nr:uncharacterized protein LOC132726895 [Ruditapes philippinarum]